MSARPLQRLAIDGDRLRDGVDIFLSRVNEDPQIGAFFAAADTLNLRKKLLAVLRVLAIASELLDNGYLTASHRHLALSAAHLERVIEHLRAALTLAGIPTGQRDQLIDRVAALRTAVLDEPPEAGEHGATGQRPASG